MEPYEVLARCGKYAGTPLCALDGCSYGTELYPGHERDTRPSAQCFMRFRFRVTAVEEMVREKEGEEWH